MLYQNFVNCKAKRASFVLQKDISRDRLQQKGFEMGSNGNSSTSPKRHGRALDKKCLLMTFPSEPLVQIQNNFSELFLMMDSTKTAHTVLLSLIQGLPGL